MDPRHHLRIVTWNCGGLTTQMKSIRMLLLQHSPALLLLQVARSAAGSYSVLRAECKTLGYSVSINSTNNLVAICRHGLSIASLRPSEGDKLFRIQRLALLVAGKRFLIRHVHGPHFSGQERKDFVTHLNHKKEGAFCVDAGDFNHVPSATSDMSCFFPPVHTFRANGADEKFISTLDGFRVSHGTANNAALRCLEPVVKAQHKPVLLDLNYTIDSFQVHRWARPGFLKEAVGADWNPAMKAAFQEALAGNFIDHAWEIWATNSGATAATCEQAYVQGGWCAGDSYNEICRLFKRARQLQAAGRSNSEAQVAEILENISVLIEAASATQLEKWKEKVSTRQGAAKWIREKLGESSEDPVPPEPSFTPADLTKRLADELCSRWNCGYSVVKNLTGWATSGLFGGNRSLPYTKRPPETRRFGQRNLSVFPQAPRVPELSAWSTELIYDLLSDGSPGPDGITSDDIYMLSDDSLQALVQLLNKADGGQLPGHWREGRVAMIPKPDAPGERRPLTVMNITYRLWAKRLAMHYNAWLDSWAPSGLVGARVGEFAADTTQRVANIVNQAVAGNTSSRFFLTLDQSKFFDRIDLQLLREMCNHFGLQHGHHLVDGYAGLARHIFVDGTPTAHVLHGTHACGIPQGCPASCFFANLIACYWLCSCQGMNCDTTAYLDDWLIIGESWDVLERVYQQTLLVCSSVGSTLNLRKTYRAAALPAAQAIPACHNDLSGVPLVSTFKYLGTDISFRQKVKRAAAARRVSDYCRRAGLIRIVHFTQRSALLSDANASLWLAAGCAYNVSQRAKLVSAGAVAQFSLRTTGAVLRGSRALLHLTGPGLHFTHAGAAAIYAAVRQSIRMRKRGLWSQMQWQQLHASRHAATCGMAFALSGALASLGIAWTAPSTFQCHGKSFTFRMHQDENGRQTMRLGQFNSLMHDLRCYLRRAVVIHEAGRLPFNFGGLSNGWSEDACVRRSTHALRFHSGMPSILSGAAWTRWNSWKCGYDPSPVCARCGNEDESLGHRLWRCPGNSIFRQWLDVQLGDFQLDSVLDTLPRCLTRCALAPANCPLTPHQVVALQQYIAMVNNYAASYYDCYKKQTALPVPQIQHDALEAAYQRLRRLAIKPLKKTQGKDLAVGHAGTQAQPYQAVCPELHFDGSYTPDSDEVTAKAGAGLVVALPGEDVLCFSCEVVTNRHNFMFRGATHLSNNVAELTGAVLCLEHAATLPPSRIIIGYDSEYARRTITGEWRARRSARLVARGRLALRRLMASHIIEWQHIDSHTGHTLNDLADHHASLGADGVIQLPAWCRAEPAARGSGSPGD